VGGIIGGVIGGLIGLVLIVALVWILMFRRKDLDICGGDTCKCHCGVKDRFTTRSRLFKRFFMTLYEQLEASANIRL